MTTPQRRMKAVERLAAAGISVTVNIAPLILGLGDRDVPSILEAAAAAGARGASLIPLRLPGAVKEVFSERLQARLPARRRKGAAPHARNARRQAVRLALRRAHERRG